MGKWKPVRKVVWACLFVISTVLAGCMSSPADDTPSQPQESLTSPTNNLGTQGNDTAVDVSDGVRLDGQVNPALRHLVMTDCAGLFSRIDEPAPLFPFYGPSGWESFLPLDDLMQTEGYFCSSAIINERIVITNTTLIFESHDNIAPPSDHPFPGPYNSLRAALSVHADPPEFSMWLKTILPLTKEGAEVQMDRSNGDRQETITLTTPTGNYVTQIGLEDRLDEPTSTTNGPHRLMLDYEYPYLWVDETGMTCGDALILAEYSTATGDMAATQMQPFPGSPLPSRSVINLCSSLEWTLGGSEL